MKTGSKDCANIARYIGSHFYFVFVKCTICLDLPEENDAIYQCQMGHIYCQFCLGTFAIIKYLIKLIAKHD